MSAFEIYPEIRSIVFTDLDTVPVYETTKEINDIIISSIKHYFINNFRSLSPKKTHNLFELFRRHYNAMLEDYPSASAKKKEYPLEKHFSTDTVGYINWVLQLHMRKIVALSEEQIVRIERDLACEFVSVKRNIIRIKLLDKDIAYRQDCYAYSLSLGHELNDISAFNKLLSFSKKPCVNLLPKLTSRYFVQPHQLTGKVDDIFGKNTIYEIIINDDVNAFMDWLFIRDGLSAFLKAPSFLKEDRRYPVNALCDLCYHIRTRCPINIIRYLIINKEERILGTYPDDDFYYVRRQLDPWEYAVNNPEAYRLLSEYYRPYHIELVKELSTTALDSYFSSMSWALPRALPEIAERMFLDLHELYQTIHSSPLNVIHSLAIGFMFTKYGHTGWIAYIDETELIDALQTPEKQPAHCLFLDDVKDTLMGIDVTARRFSQPYGMNQSSVLFLHDYLKDIGVRKMVTRFWDFDGYYQSDEHAVTMVWDFDCDLQSDDFTDDEFYY